MSIKRKITGFLFIFALTFFVFMFAPINNVNAEEMGEKGLSIDSETGVITSMVIGEISGDVVIPDEICGIPVTGIKDGVFAYCDDITSITIPDSVTSIGNEAFLECDNLVSVTLPSNLKTIGFRSFYMCPKLESITMPDSVTGIGGEAFGHCTNLKNVKLSENLTSTGFGAFGDCINLKNITLPNSLNKIGKSSFSGCSSLESIDIPTSITVIDVATFSGCTSLEKVKLPENLTKIEGDAFQGCEYSIKYIEFPSSLKSMDYRAFSGSLDVDDLVLPENLEEIGESAFANCKIKNLYIKSGLNTIGNESLDWIKNLESITVDEGNQSFSSKDGVLFDKDKTELIKYPSNNPRKEYTIPQSVVKVSDCAFNYSMNLEKIRVGENVSDIAYYALNSCNYKTYVYAYKNSAAYQAAKESSCNVIALDDNYKMYFDTVEGGSILYDEKNGEIIDCDDFVTSVDISNNINGTEIKSIGSSAFTECNKLTNINLPDSITEIKDNAFNSCESLNNIHIPESVNSIGQAAFKNCLGLSSLTLPKNITLIGEEAFPVNEEFTLNVYGGSVGLSYAKANSIKYNLLESASINNSNVTVTFDRENYEYTSAQIRPIIEVKYNDIKLNENVDYLVSYGENINVGLGSVTIKGIDGYSGEITKQFNIVKKGITKDNVILEKDTYEYTSNEIRPNVAVKVDEKTLTENKDYTISYSDNIMPGEGKITITGIGNYSGEVVKTFNIEKINLKDENVTIENDSYLYTSNEIKPNVKVIIDDKELILNTDYNISYENNINEGQGSVLVKGIGIYQGTVTKTFKIEKDDISNKAIKLSYTSTTYTGAKKCPTVSINGLKKDVDYTVSYGSNTNAGNGTVTIQGKGVYKGSITKTFTISKASISKKSAKLSYTTATYSGKKRLPSASVSGLKYKRDFVISGGRTSIGKGYVYIKGTGNYTGTITKSFKIVPKKVSIKKPSAGKKKIAIKYYRTSGSCYYQVAYRKAGSSKWYYKNTKSSYKIVTKLKSKKYYYVKVRAYKSVGGVKYYGSWSNTRKVKVK